ncbi:MAG TPA: PHP domain-containing protein [Candidatus Omnitrophota bacterium]|nr:PHP domain-containing protein [Candidatus Omnitrophota bacterium]
MTRFADLHIHTHFSDSTSSPEEVVEQAHDNGLSCIAIADHDTVEGVGPTIEAAKKYDIEVLPAIELSSEINGKDVHILGYLFDCGNAEFLGRIRRMQDSRMTRMKEMIGKLKELGIDNISSEEVNGLTQSDSVGRPHLAALLQEKGWVKTQQMAFNKYLADDAPAFVPKFKQTPYEAIDLIRKAGGVAVLAHPMLTRVDELIKSLVDAGLGGLEVYYPGNFDSVTQFYEGLAKKYGLLATGGSDAHGNIKKHTYIGKIKIPYELVEKLKSACVS